MIRHGQFRGAVAGAHFDGFCDDLFRSRCVSGELTQFLIVIMFRIVAVVQFIGIIITFVVLNALFKCVNPGGCSLEPG